MCNVQTEEESMGGNMSGWKNYGREYVQVKKSYWREYGRGVKNDRRDYFGREFACIL